MTLFVSFRAQDVGGPVAPAQIRQGDARGANPTLAVLKPEDLAARVAGRNVLFAVHGFNVSGEHGARSLAQLEAGLGPTASEVFIGVLWPGDCWVPVVNYPFEGDDTRKCGQLLAELCRGWLTRALSLSFFSHSLGARVVLEAAKNLERPARLLCLTAGAVNRDCITAQYASAAARAPDIAVLASQEDRVLWAAYPLGDLIANLLHRDHDSLRGALGYRGPSPVPAQVTRPWQIPDGENYGHGSYLPPGGYIDLDPNNTQWARVARCVAEAFRQGRQTWP